MPSRGRNATHRSFHLAIWKGCTQHHSSPVLSTRLCQWTRQKPCFHGACILIIKINYSKMGLGDREPLLMTPPLFLAPRVLQSTVWEPLQSRTLFRAGVEKNWNYITAFNFSMTEINASRNSSRRGWPLCLRVHSAEPVGGLSTFPYWALMNAGSCVAHSASYASWYVRVKGKMEIQIQNADKIKCILSKLISLENEIITQISFLRQLMWGKWKM